MAQPNSRENEAADTSADAHDDDADMAELEREAKDHHRYQASTTSYGRTLRDERNSSRARRPTGGHTNHYSRYIR